MTHVNDRPRSLDEALVRALRQRVGDRLAAEKAAVESGGARLDGQDEEERAAALAWEAIEENAAARIQAGQPAPMVDDDLGLHAALLDRMFGASALAPLLARDDVSDIHVHGARPVSLTLLDGRVVWTDPIVDTDDDLIEMIRELGRRGGQSERLFDQAHPRIGRRLPGGSRLTALGWVSTGTHLFVRLHHLVDVTLDDLVRVGSVTPLLRSFLGAAVRARLNIIISGGQGVGKTTLLRALAADIDPTERITTIESDFELGLDELSERHHEVVALEGREPNIEGTGAVTLSELVRWAKRTAARRLMVGEVLGPEVVPMLDAMNSGSDGSMCTIHANSPAEAFEKIALLATQADPPLEWGNTCRFCGMAINLAIQVRQTPDGRRVIDAVHEVTGGAHDAVSTNELFSSGADGLAQPTGVALRQSTAERVALSGFDPRWLLGQPR